MFNGKVALITGASSGVGAAIAKKYAKEGAHVILLGRDLKKLEAVDDIIQVFGGQSTIINMDLTEFEKIASLASTISNHFEKLDILVSSATHMEELSLLVDYTEETWDLALKTNLHANWYLIKYFDPLLKISEAGRAIFVSSDVIDMPNPSFWGPYAITKSALTTMVKIYAEETKHTKLKANLVIPGPIATRTHQKSYPGQDISLMAQLDDIMDVFLKLASEECHFSGKVHYAQY